MVLSCFCRLLGTVLYSNVTAGYACTVLYVRTRHKLRPCCIDKNELQRHLTHNFMHKTQLCYGSGPRYCTCKAKALYHYSGRIRLAHEEIPSHMNANP